MIQVEVQIITNPIQVEVNLDARIGVNLTAIQQNLGNPITTIVQNLP
jgi:hypothetical protein